MKAAAKTAGIIVPAMAEDGSPLGFSIEIDPAKVGDCNASSLAAAAVRWEPRVFLDGAALPFSKENAAVLFQRLPFLVRQIAKAVKKEQ